METPLEMAMELLKAEQRGQMWATINKYEQQHRLSGKAKGHYGVGSPYALLNPYATVWLWFINSDDAKAWQEVAYGTVHYDTWVFYVLEDEESGRR